MVEKYNVLFNKYQRNIYRVLRDTVFREAIWRSVIGSRINREKAFRKYPHVKKLAEKLRDIRYNTILNLQEYVKITMENMEDANMHVYFAKTAQDARRIIGKIVGSNKIIVKSKSMTTEEIGLNEYLATLQNEVWETDLGEFIIQLANRKPMHLVEPAIGIPKEKIAELFSKLAKREIPPYPEELTKFAREFLREKYFKADVGISGANVIAAETGTIFIIENEGNARFVTNAPPVHIVIAGIEKIVPTLQDAMLQIEVLSRYAGYTMPSYISLISGPSKTGDIEKNIIYGAHGPREVHVVLLDNGRSEMAEHPIFREALLCIRCGSCLYECPVFEQVAGFYGSTYFGGIGAVWTRFTYSPLHAYVLAFSCTLCGRCKEICPMKIDTPTMILELRKEAAKQGFIPRKIRRILIREYGFNVESSSEKSNQ